MQSKVYLVAHGVTFAMQFSVRTQSFSLKKCGFWQLSGHYREIKVRHEGLSRRQRNISSLRRFGAYG